MHVLKFKVRIKVVVQSPLALVPQLHMLSHSQTAEQWVYSSGRQVPSCSFGSLSPLLPQEQRWWFIFICELIRKTCIAHKSKINISCWNVTLCSLASIPLGELEKCGRASSCGGWFRISELWLWQDLFQCTVILSPSPPVINVIRSVLGIWQHPSVGWLKLVCGLMWWCCGEGRWSKCPKLLMMRKRHWESPD